MIPGSSYTSSSDYGGTKLSLRNMWMWRWLYLNEHRLSDSFWIQQTPIPGSACTELEILKNGSSAAWRSRGICLGWSEVDSGEAPNAAMEKFSRCSPGVVWTSKNTFHPKVDHHSIMSFGEYTPYLPLNPGVIIVRCFFWWGIHHVQTNPTIFGVFGSKPRCQVTLTSKGYHQYYVTFPPVSTHRGCGRTRGGWVEYIFQWLSQGAMASGTSGTKQLRLSIFNIIQPY